MKNKKPEPVDAKKLPWYDRTNNMPDRKKPKSKPVEYKENTHSSGWIK